MAATTSPNTYEQILQLVRKGEFSPIYYLMGEESYYIDKLSEQILQCALKPEERDFNLDLLYGHECKIEQVIECAQTYPMMASRRVVLVREAQALRNIDLLESYLKQPTQSTVLVFCHKYGKLDARKAVSKAIQQRGVLFESKKVYESGLPRFITSYLKQSHVTADAKTVDMLALHVGTDLTRVALELDKLILSLPQGESHILPERVEALTGLSKDYNVYELIHCLACKDIAQAQRIVMYFKNNPRSFALGQILSNIFTFFSDVLISFYSKDASPNGLAEWLGKPVWKINQEILPARQNYTGGKVWAILSEIRQVDAKSKGVGGCKTPPNDLLQELIFMIFH